MVADGGHHGKRQHDQADMPVPAVPRAALVVVESELVLGALEAVFDRPTLAFDQDQRLDARAERAPGGEVSALAIGQVAPDQQAAGPGARQRGVKLVCVQVSQLQVGPVMQPCALCAQACRQALPGRGVKTSRNPLGCSN